MQYSALQRARRKETTSLSRSGPEERGNDGTNQDEGRGGVSVEGSQPRRAQTVPNRSLFSVWEKGRADRGIWENFQCSGRCVRLECKGGQRLVK